MAVSHEAWARSMIGFIRERGLEQELSDWCGGWPCPVESMSPGEEIGLAAKRILELAPNAGLHVGITIKSASTPPRSIEGEGL